MGSCKGVFHAVDKETGQVRWTYGAIKDAREGGRAEFHDNPVVAGDLVLAATDDRDPGGFGHVYALERATGRLRWKHRVERGVMSDLLQSGRSVFAFSLTDELLSLDLQTGRVNWSRKLAAGTDGAASYVMTPAMDRDRLYAGSRSGTISAVDTRTGRLHWRTALGSRVVAPVVLHGDVLYTATERGEVVRLRRGDGRTLGRIAAGGPVSGPALPLGRDLAFFAGEPPAGSGDWTQALKLVDGALEAEKWTRRAARGWTSSRPLAWRGGILVGGEQGELTAFRASDGTVVWSGSVKGVVRGIGFEGDRLYVGTLRGTVYAYDPPAAATVP